MADMRRPWSVQRVDDGTVPPDLGCALLRELVHMWPALVLRLYHLSSTSMAGDAAQMVAHAKQLVRVRDHQIALLNDGLMGLYSVLRVMPADEAQQMLVVRWSSLAGVVASALDGSRIDPNVLAASVSRIAADDHIMALLHEPIALDGGHDHAEAIELVADAFMRERAAAKEVVSDPAVRACRHADGCPCVKLWHAHAMRQALLIDALRAQIAAALAQGSPDRHGACMIAVCA